MESRNSSPISDNALQFKAETRQLLDILIHSLYHERDIFLRELISNASDALTRMNFEMLTNRDVIDPEVVLAIHITVDKEAGTLTISDTGIGMTAEELQENLGTIAHSGAGNFVKISQGDKSTLNEVIGQFGVGFYSVFMVADSVKVISRSFLPEASPASWSCSGSDYYTIEPADRVERGTSVVVHLKDDAQEFLDDSRLRETIRKHSDFVAFPIYIGDSKDQINRQTALWRQPPRNIEKKDYEEFYRQLTLDFTPPLKYSHMAVDAPVQMYALLYIPSKGERGIFSLRREDGLKLYSRKILIQEYCKDLLPEYFRFIQGIVDSEDLPLNVSRETYQSNRVIAQLRKLVTSKVVDILEKLALEEPENYDKFWQEFGRFIKEGVAVEQENPEGLYSLLRFHTAEQPEQYLSLDEYIKEMKGEQKEIYFLLGDDPTSLTHSPHLEAPQKYGYSVLLLTDPIDSFVLVRLKQYKEHPLVNIANANLKLPPKSSEESTSEENQVPQEDWSTLIDCFKEQLGDQVADVRMTDRLIDSSARLVDPEGTQDQEMQRVYRLLKQDFVPPKKILEINPGHPILIKLNTLDKDDQRSKWAIVQIYENALLIEGLHPDPARMIDRIQKLIEAALG
jgi:molecular chaperone HtpG